VVLIKMVIGAIRIYIVLLHHLILGQHMEVVLEQGECILNTKAVEEDVEVTLEIQGLDAIWALQTSGSLMVVNFLIAQPLPFTLTEEVLEEEVEVQ
jgi:hypothetical protein